jgi:arylsulfatase A-like enzyme
MTDRPNILLIMTDEERYPPPYEGEDLHRFRTNQLPARTELQARGLTLHRHYAASTACSASRATLFTGQYPSLHGVTSTGGIAKSSRELTWLDPDQVPTMGDWFRAAGYQSHYRGKWHISHADIPTPPNGEGLMTQDATGKVFPDNVEAYRRADRLEPFGFSGWIGREPEGIKPQDMGLVRDGEYAEQVTTMFGELAASRSDDGPWLAVASFVNPHDILFSGMAWTELMHLQEPDDTVPDVAAPPSQDDGFTGRPSCHEDFANVWPQMTYPQQADVAYRRLYYYLHKVVDRAIGRILEALEESGMADDTIIMFTSDHGDLVGAHGGMMQKWYNAFDESIRVPMVVAGPTIATREDGISMPTSHVDVIPTALGLVGADMERAAAEVSLSHTEAQPLPGRDLSGLLRGSVDEARLRAPLYFMTEDDFSRGSRTQNPMTGTPFTPVPHPSRVESVIAVLPATDGGLETWKLNHYYERLDDWNAEQGMPIATDATPAAESAWELYNLTNDPEERQNLVEEEPQSRRSMEQLLVAQRDEKRRLPTHRNPATTP